MSDDVEQKLKRAATVADVARLAGVSPMTVSRVVNGGGNVRAEKRDAVLAAVRSLNYAPNPAARSLASGRVVRLGLLYSNPSAAYLSEFLVGCLDECRRRHIQLSLEKCDDDVEAATHELLAGGLEGVLLPPPLCENESILQILTHHRVPAVGVAAGRSRQDISTVRIDDAAAAEAMTRHLLQLGHRRIGFIKGHPNQTASAERLAGYTAALRDAGLELSSELVVEGFFDYRSGITAAERLLALPTRPTAIFAANDDMAAAVIAVAHRRGLALPAELSVCGFDDSALATNVWPELTTIHQPISAMAREAVALLARQLEKGAAGRSMTPEHVLLPFSLVRRASDGSPAAA